MSFKKDDGSPGLDDETMMPAERSMREHSHQCWREVSLSHNMLICNKLNERVHVPYTDLLMTIEKMWFKMNHAIHREAVVSPDKSLKAGQMCQAGIQRLGKLQLKESRGPGQISRARVCCVLGKQ